MVWRKRSVFTFGFKGRARRQLFWKKNIYWLWYNFAKQSTRKIPKEFGDLSKFDSFEEWWRHPDYGFELFCEPVEEPPIEIVDLKSENETKERGVMYLKVNLDEEPQRLLFLFSRLLKKKQSNKKIEKPSKARFQPSVIQKGIKRKALSDYLDIWIWRNKEGCSRREAYVKYHNENTYNVRKINELDVTEENLRFISRACQRVREIFKSIERGTFP